jgi:hypothetical protein
VVTLVVYRLGLVVLLVLQIVPALVAAQRDVAARDPRAGPGWGVRLAGLVGARGLVVAAPAVAAGGLAAALAAGVALIVLAAGGGRAAGCRRSRASRCRGCVGRRRPVPLRYPAGCGTGTSSTGRASSRRETSV